MSLPKITKSMKKDITAFWNEFFPEMGVYKPMFLMNILGPFSVGISLEIQSERDRYFPTLYLQNLSKEVDYIAYEVAIHKEYIRPTATKEKTVRRIIQELQENIFIPTSGNILISDMVSNLKSYCEETYVGLRYPVILSLIYLAGWSGQTDIILDIKEFSEYVIRKGGIFKTYKEADQWLEELFKKIQDTEGLKQAVIRMEKKFGYEKLPHRELIL